MTSHVSLQPYGLQHARPPCPSPFPEVCSNSCPLNQWCHSAISPSDTPLLFLPSIFPSIIDFSNDSAAHIRWPKYWSFSFTISSSSEYSGLISFKIDLVWSPCCPRDPHESSTAPQFEGFNSSVRCLLHGPALTTILDQWEDHSLDYTDLCWQSNVSAFQHTV